MGSTSSSYNIISRNDFSGNQYGIYLVEDSTYNTIIENTFSNNNYGIYIDKTPGDTPKHNNIYHNNFYNSSEENARDECNNNWDNGYPDGGNYWDDYVGIDQFSGPGQNITGSDGIGDTPYNISGKKPPKQNQDLYPLMDPYSPSPTEYIIDNSDPEFTVINSLGGGGLQNHANAYNGSAVYTWAGNGSKKAAWRVHDVVDPGVYDVYVWKFEHDHMNLMATNAHYIVRDRNGFSDWITVDQSTPGNEWVPLGSYEFDGGYYQGVLINDDADGYVIADAIKLVYAGPLS